MQSQTGSITIPPGLSAQVGAFGSADAVEASVFNAQCTGRPEIMSAPAFQQNFTVAPGQTQVFWLGIGGIDYNLIGNSHSFAIGGLPSGAPQASWYDFFVSLNADESFHKLNVAYQKTGGTNVDNGQNGFNVTQCSTANGNLTATGNVLTPFSWGTNNNLNYGANQPICMGWAPLGTMETFEVVQSAGPTSSPAGQPSSLTPLGAQLNTPNGVGSVSIAGILPEGVTVVSAQVANGGSATTPASAFPYSAFGWFTTYGTEWAVIDIPIANFAGGTGCIVKIQASDGSTVSVSINGVPGIYYG